MNTNESQSKENQAEQTAPLADLEPNSEVMGGGGAAGGIVSEGQGYGIFISGTTAASHNPGSGVPTGTVVFRVDGVAH